MRERFNPRPRTGGDAAICCDSRSNFRFQSAPPHGGRRRRRAQRIMVLGFNPRPRTGGDRQGPEVRGLARLFQSAPPHGGRRGPGDGQGPQRSFNPRPRTGGDAARSRSRSLHWRFNPRPRTGGDLAARPGQTIHVVSIRAPARGATRKSGLLLSSPGFQSAPPHGGRPDSSPGTGWPLRFQSAPPHGGRRVRCQVATVLRGRFNPRPRTGGDEPAARWIPCYVGVSIRAPARGATWHAVEKRLK